ncbi:hypothetical protein [Maribacter sp. 2308TA10-17]|uniref:hypothetical protein n=1 Tax=Maribacter sp. 2308TA10-17 TaxID=3386276 RepID=UPI0039BD0184
MNFHKISSIILLLTTIVFLALYISTKKELNYYVSNDLTYLSGSNEDCDIYNWKKNNNTSWFGCDLKGTGFYTRTTNYNFFGKQLMEFVDSDENGLYEIQKHFNIKGQLAREYHDLNADGFFDELRVFNNGEQKIFSDENMNGVFEESEIKTNADKG